MVNFDFVFKGSEGENVDPERPQESGRSAYKNKRNRDEDEDEIDYEGLSLLFDESNEDSIVEVIDEKTLEQEGVLPQASGIEVNLNVNSWKYIFSRLIILSSIGSTKKPGCEYR